MKKLIEEYRKRKREIKNRLKEFKNIRHRSDMFAELCFCVLTSQSKAVNCDKAIKELKKSGLLFSGKASAVKKILKGLVRFHNKKSAYLINARKIFGNNRGFNIGRRLERDDIFKTREWLVENVKGLGYKEASHFLRNIGLGRDLAILDVHILRNLRRLGILKEIPKTLTRKSYVEIENKMREFSKKAKIPLEELDLLFWSGETGFVFK